MNEASEKGSMHEHRVPVCLLNILCMIANAKQPYNNMQPRRIRFQLSMVFAIMSHAHACVCVIHAKTNKHDTCPSEYIVHLGNTSFCKHAMHEVFDQAKCSRWHI